MIGCLVLLLGAWAIVLVAALAQAPVEPAPAAAPTPTPRPTPPAQARPTEVMTPTEEAEAEAADEAMRPLRPGLETDTMVEPGTELIEQEAIDQAALAEVDLSGRKRWRLTPLFSAGVEYNDNIFLSRSDPVADVIFTISPGLIFELGDFRDKKENYLSFLYIGQPVFYAENSAQNAVNHFVGLKFQYRFTKLVLTFKSDYSHIRGPNRDVNTITTTDRFWNSLAFDYDYSDKTKLNVTFAQNASLTQDFQNTNQYEVRTGVRYQLLPKTQVGLQGVGGVLDSSDTPLQYYQQLRLELLYIPTQKLSFLFNGGVQFLEFSDTVKIDPVFSLGLFYQPFPATMLSLSGFRNVVGSSAEAGEDYFATGFEINVSQQFFQRLVASVGAGYENDSYFGTTPETPTNREDNYVFVRPRLTYAFVDWFSVSVFYEFRQTVSNQEGNSFENNRAGLEVLTKF
jgi:Putative beta-barrel porin 2